MQASVRVREHRIAAWKGAHAGRCHKAPCCVGHAILAHYGATENKNPFVCVTCLLELAAMMGREAGLLQ